MPGLPLYSNQQLSTVFGVSSKKSLQAVKLIKPAHKNAVVNIFHIYIFNLMS